MIAIAITIKKYVYIKTKTINYDNYGNKLH